MILATQVVPTYEFHLDDVDLIASYPLTDFFGDIFLDPPDLSLKGQNYALQHHPEMYLHCPSKG